MMEVLWRWLEWIKRSGQISNAMWPKRFSENHQSVLLEATWDGCFTGRANNQSDWGRQKSSCDQLREAEHCGVAPRGTACSSCHPNAERHHCWEGGGRWGWSKAPTPRARIQTGLFSYTGQEWTKKGAVILIWESNFKMKRSFCLFIFSCNLLLKRPKFTRKL